MAKQPRNARAQTPVTRHPLFPAIVALWFGALFGLGSLAIRPGLIESAVLASGIDTIVPAAGPPLGVTARILIALTLAALGGLLGASVARRLAAPRPDKIDASGALERMKVRARDSHPDAPARRPISIPDEIAAAPLDNSAAAAAAYPGRRRALAIAEDAPQFRAHEYAPLPGGGPRAVAEPEWSPVAEEAAKVAPEPLELGTFIAPVEPAAESIAATDELPRQTFRPLAELAQETIVAPAPPFAAPLAEPAFAAPMAEPAFAAPMAEPLFPAPTPESLFAAPTSEPLFVPPVAEPVAATAFAAPPPPPLDFARLGADTPPGPTPPSPAFAAVVEAAPAPALEGLDLTALTERFAASLRRRREQQGEASLPGEAPQQESPSFAALPPEPEPKAEPVVPEVSAPPEQPVFAPAPLAMPAAFRPIARDEVDEDDVGELESLLPPRQFAMPTVATAAVEPDPDVVPQDTADEEAEPEVDSGYSSLLELGRPPAQRQSFVRIEEPDADHAAIEPVVIFPGQAARSAPLASVPLAVPQPFASPAAVPAPEVPAEAPAGTLRRFDAPGSALAGQAVSASGAAPQVDREETERALRAALATLQRMSGAA